MSISSVSSSDPIGGITAVSPQVAPVATVEPPDAASGVSVSISKPGQLFGQLSSLASSDPDKFKTVTADIAQKLKDAASSQDGRRADFLNQLADKFGAASQSGSAAGLAPTPGSRAHGHHGGHHHHAQAANGNSGSSSSGGGDHGGGQPGGATAGQGSPGALAQTVESIFSDALNSVAT
ncbi:MAG: hypothetical protein QOI66_2056 [Myxococcales bacterium]|jgi:hypothetical protein|nr:hypothetical protein [Myxococcales bacterium]